MKDQILKLIADKPKQFSKLIKHTPELLNWVESNSIIKSTNMSEMIYSALHNENRVCKYGSIKKFSGITEGYRGCGPTKYCQCAREKVSNSVIVSKKKITIDDQNKINNKRRKTNILKYGVSCAAQTLYAKNKLKAFYADPILVKEMTEKIKETYVKKYGVENCRHLPAAEQKRLATLLTRYNVTNVSQIPSVKAKLQARTAEYKLSGHLIKKGYLRFCKYINDRYNFTLLTSSEKYKGIVQKNAQEFQFTCNTCQTEINQKFYHSRGLNCEICNPTVKHYTSNEEQEVYDFISNELGISGHQSNKKIINPYELDMVFPDKQIAVEYCGLYWHSEFSSGKEKNYHFNKMKLAKAAGYKLITIFSDEWNLHKSIVKSRLRNIFNCTINRHFARKLIVKDVTGKDAKEFLNKYHSQGNSVAKFNLGLYYPDSIELLALMTFSNGRKALNTKIIDHDYELVRFVTNGDSIVGGASKLLTAFIKRNNPTKIITYADLRWSNGNLYEKIGFSIIGSPTIGYWYVDEYEKRIHRYNFTKQTLVNEGADIIKTEWEIMQELGYDRIWDCGHQKYVMNVKQETP